MDQQNFIAQPSEQNRSKGALDAFLNLLSLVTVGWYAIAFGGTIFQIINKYFSVGSYLRGYEMYYSGTLKFHIASLIIITPIFLFLTGALHKQYKENTLSSRSGIHRWLTYLMLFISFCNILGSLIALVYKFLDGEFFSAFILKALTVFIIALGIFGYYWYDLKRTAYEKRSSVSLVSTLIIILLSLGAIIGGFVISGSPQKARMLKYDSLRVNDLSNIRYQIDSYYREKSELPLDLSGDQFRGFMDPETKMPYEYKKLGDNEFQLCATFSLDAFTNDTRTYYGGTDSWNYHKAGHQCYSLKVEKPVNVYEKPAPMPLPIEPAPAPVQ